MKKFFYFVLLFISFSSILFVSIQAKDQVIKDKFLKEDKLKVNFKFSQEESINPNLKSLNLINNSPLEQSILNDKFIIQFNNKIKDSWIKDLEDLNVKFYDYVPENSYLVKIDFKNYEKVKEKDYIIGLAEYKANYKGLTQTNKISKTKKNELIDVEVTLFENLNKSNLKSVISEIENLGGEFRRNNALELENSNAKIFIIRIDSSKLLELNSIVEIKNIEEFKLPKIDNSLSRTIMNVSQIWDNFNYNLFGSGQIITVADTGLDVGVNNASMHDDIEGRITLIQNFIDSSVSNDGASDLDSAHGTHVTGSVLGNGNKSNSNSSSNNYSISFAGTAPKANLIFQAIEQLCDNSPYCGSYFGDYLLLGIPSDLADLFSPAYSNNSRIHTNSWGSDCGGDYSSNSVEVDTYSWNNKDFTILFAAGNDGSASNTIGCPATAKNTISVGATQYASAIASFSSRGPTDDGRIKPDVVAPGYNIISTRSSLASGTLWGVYNSDYLYSSGTSMATPLVAGITALIREHIQNNLSYSTPSSALIKAFLINGARDMTPNDDVLFDYNYGWGMVNLKNSIITNETYEINYFDNTTGLNTNEYNSFNLEIPSELNNSNIPIKITLVWTDYPSTTISSINLVNDLDLSITLPNGSIYYGNNFNYSGDRDRLNNVEVVYVKTPISGNYIINISAYNIPQGPQSYAIVYSYPNIYTTTSNFSSPIQNANYENIFPSFNLIGNFSRNITSLTYSIDENIVNITNLLINETIINTTINLTREREINLTLNYTDSLGFTNSKEILFNVSVLNPKITISNPLNSSNINISNLEVDFVANFSKNIKYLTYNISNIIFNISNEIQNSSINTSLDIFNYNQNQIEFNFTDFYNKSNTYILIFNASLVFLNSNSNDTDGDGINDSLDKLKGNSSNIKTTYSNLLVKVNNNSNLTQSFNNLTNVSFYSGSIKLIEFENNFSDNSIDLSNITLKNSSSSNKSKVLVRGLKLGSSKKKTIYLDLIGNLTRDKSICIKDKEIYDFSEITSSCNGENETYLNSIPSTNGIYSISYDTNSTTRVKISGLTHSGVSQVCSENWTYSEWSSCSSNSQTRTATDLNSCSTTNNRSSLTQSCSSPSSGGSSGGGGGSSSSSSSSSSTSTITTTTSSISSPKVYNIINSPVKEEIKNNLYINGISLTSENNFSGLNKVILKDENNSNLVSFDYNFSNSSLDLSNFQIENSNRYDDENNLQNYIIVKGLKEEITKEIRLKISLERETLCIKDSEINSITQISSTCDAQKEFKLICDSTLQFENYSCKIENGYYIINGLKHSGVIEFGEIKKEAKELVDTITIENNKETLKDSELPILFEENSNDSLNNESSNSILSLDKISEISIYYLLFIIIFVFCILFLIVHLISSYSRKKDYHKHKLTYEERYHDVYNHIRDYLLKYKDHYKKRDLVANLYEEDFPKGIIKKVVKDVYSKKK